MGNSCPGFFVRFQFAALVKCWEKLAYNCNAICCCTRCCVAPRFSFMKSTFSRSFQSHFWRVGCIRMYGTKWSSWSPSHKRKHVFWPNFNAYMFVFFGGGGVLSRSWHSRSPQDCTQCVHAARSVMDANLLLFKTAAGLASFLGWKWERPPNQP